MLVALSFFALTAIAQKNNVNKASSAVMNENYEKAKEFIHLALDNTETKVQAKTWYYKGRIYEGLVKRSDVLNDTVVEQMETAVDAYLKSAELDEGSDYRNSSEEQLKGFVGVMMSKVAPLYNSKDYATATKILKVVIKADPSATNYSYLASASYAIGEYELAYDSFKKTIDLGNLDENMFLNLFSLANGLKKPYDDQGAYLTKAIETYPSNVKFRHNDIQAYESSEGATVSAINEKYEAVLAIDDKDLISLFNLGAYYYNEAAKANNDAGLKSETKTLFEKALGYLERAYAVNPDDADVKSVLKKAYTYLGMGDKAGGL